MKKEVKGRWGRVATRCAAIAERDEDSRREDLVYEERGTGPLGSRTRSDPLCGNC